MKKFLSFILILILSVSLFQIALYAEEIEQENKEKVYKLALPQNDRIFEYLGFTDSNSLEKHEEEINFYNQLTLEDVYLNSEQADKVRIMKRETNENLKGINKQISDKYIALEKELSQHSLVDNSKVINNLQNEIHNLYSKKIKEALNHKKQLREILTNEQYYRMLSNTKLYKELKIELTLEREQLDKVIMLFETEKQNSYNLKRNLQDVMLSLSVELNKQNFDSKKVSTLNNKMLELSKEMLKVAIDAKIKLKKIISPEQYRTFYKNFPIFTD